MLLLMAPFYYEDVGSTNVVTGYEYADPVAPTSGTNADLSPTTDLPLPDTSPAVFWGFTQPALSAVDPSVNVPGFGPGEAVPINDAPQFECSNVIHTVCASTGETKTHCFTPVDEDGSPIDLMGAPLVFVAERGDRVDTETGSATQDPSTLKVSFTATQAHNKEGTFPFAVRMLSGNRLVGKGEIVVSYAPVVGISQVENSFCFTGVKPGSIVRVTKDEPTEQNPGLLVAEAIVGGDGVASFNLPVGAYWGKGYFDGLKFDAIPFEIKANDE